MVGYCYLCEKNFVGYVSGGYFCEDCAVLQNVVKCLGSKKITDKIKFRMETMKEMVEIDQHPVSSNTRSKSNEKEIKEI